MWRRKGSALLNIGGDAACKVDPFDKPKLNWINCVRGGQRYRLQAQGDFCATAYFQLAPYGKNIEGVTAAAWFYFHKPPAALQWTEALALAITPKSPNAYRPDRFPPAAQKHCQRLADRLLQHQKMSAADHWFIDCAQPP